MASDGGGKVKQKRNQTPSKPYERQSSLLGKLKDSVKDLLIPSWLTGTPVKQKKADDRGTMHGPSQERPGARTGQIADWSHGNAFQADNKTTSTYMSGSDYGTPASGKHPGSSIPGFGFQPPNGDLRADQSASVPLSTPSPNFNLGSQAQHVVIPNVTAGVPLSKNTVSSVGTDSCNVDQRYSEPVDRSHPEFCITPIRPIMVSTGVKSSSAKPDTKRQRLWSPEPLRKGRPLVPPPRGKPTFNSLLFGTPSKGDASSLTSSFGDSSFYVGKTCYGGASSSVRKSTMNTSLPYHSSLPLRKQVKATKMNSSFHATTSSTAQRILDTLERMSTPLEDAKKIPQGDHGNDSVLSFTPSSYRRQTSRCPVTPITRPLQLPNRGPPKGQLQPTSQIEIVRNRDKSKPVTQDFEQSLSITQETVTANEGVRHSSSQLTSSSCKMKTKKFSQHISGQQEDEVIVVPNLRTDFTLPLANMAPISLSSGIDKLAQSQVPNVALSTKPCSGTSPIKFTFARPIEEKNCSLGSQFGHQTDQGFKFSSPIHVSPGKASAAGAEGGSKSSPEPAIGAAAPHVSAWGPQMMKPKALSPDIGGTSSSFKSYTKWNGSQKNDASSASPSIGLPVAATLKKGSVMDILGKSSSVDSGQNNLPLSALFKKPAGSWECDTCMIQNKSDTNRCAACLALKPGSKSDIAAVGSDDNKLPLSALFKKPVGSWECDTCMIQNDASARKCAACTAPKPGSKLENTSHNSNIPLSDLFKKPRGTWECSTCMIQNSPSAAKCAACETPKPGTSSGSASGSVPLSVLFKKPEGTWDCDTCMIQNKPSVVKCIACETPKPRDKTASTDNSNNSLAAMFKKPEGSWECDTCMVQNSSTALRCIACDSSKPGLQSAGIVSKPSSSDNQIVINPGGGFSFKQPSANDTTTTTSGSAGLKFTNSSASVISSSSLSTGFSFGTNNSLKDSSGFSVNNSTTSTTKTMPVGGGFQPSSSPSSSGSGNSGSFQVESFAANATVVSTNSNVSISSVGFQFGAPIVTSNSSTSVSSATSGFTLGTATSKPSSGFQFGAPSSNDTSSKAGFNFNNAADTSQKTGISLTQTASSTSVSLTSKSVEFNNTSKTSAMGGFQFGSITSTPSSVIPEDKKSETNSALPQSSFSFGSTPTTTHSQTSSSPFVFGAPMSSTAKPNAVGLGMGQSLATQPSLVNGAFGSDHDSKNLSQASNVGFNVSSGGFAFGSKPSTIAKRSIDGAEHDGPSIKTGPAFGIASKEPALNGGFNFNANAGSFSFGSTQPAAGGFQFSASPAVLAAPATPTTAFAFTAKPGQAAQPAKPNEVSFTAPSNFKFSTTQPDGNAVFQFGSKTEQPSSSMFTFGAASSSTVPPQVPVPLFGAPAAAATPNAVGSFNIGAADTSQRKMKKAVRRCKPR